jgi:hypothetical protein
MTTRKIPLVKYKINSTAEMRKEIELENFLNQSGMHSLLLALDLHEQHVVWDLA